MKAGESLKRAGVFALVVYFTWVSDFLFAEIAGTGLGPSYEQMVELMRAEGEYNKSLGEARWWHARAALIEALTIHQHWQNRQLRAYVRRLELELKRLRGQEHITLNEIKSLDEKALSLKQLNIGRTSSRVFHAFRFLALKAFPPEILSQVMSPEVLELTADNFVPNRPGMPPEAFPGGNVGKLFTFLERKNFSLEPWGEAHMQILQMLSMLVASADDRIRNLRIYMEQLRAGTFDIWNPPDGNNFPRPPQPGP